ncbi:TOMM precursor leader peptide-binding protein [Luteococcus sp. H138]|uniref:TOMM precursor leader peptide-binding protein n=1 Tax=unclassified Luteococcus TaxID=2639923 RepID=UPI00313BC749
MNPRVRAERVETSRGVRYWVDETCWAELPELDREIDRRLASADGWTTTRRLHRGLGTELGGRLDSLLGLFRDSGLVVDGTGTRPLRGLSIGLTGSGSLARALAQTLLRAGVRRLECLDPGRPDPLVWPNCDHGTGAEALVRSLRPRHDVVLKAVTQVSDLADDGVDLVLVAGAQVEADRWLLDELVRHDLTHLVTGCHRDLARIGPLVMPGRSPCVHCLDVARNQQDPVWSQVLAQLSSTPARPQPTLTQTVAARAALEVGWLARGLGAAQRLHGRIELHDLHYPEVREVRFQAHPECGCTWSP